MNTEKITSRQMILTIIIFRLSLVISYMPPIELPPANQDVWIIVVISIFYVAITGAPILFLANKFRDMTMMEYFEKILGKMLGKFIIFLYGLYFGFNAVYGIILQNRIVGIDLLPQTSYWVMIVPIIVLSIYVCSKRLEDIFRIGDLISPIVLTAIIILIILGLQNAEFTELLPILSDSTFKEINTGSFTLAFVFVDIFIFIMSIPFLEEKDNINKIYGKIIIYSKFLIIIIIIVTQAALGIEQTRHVNFPFLIYTRLIEYNYMLQRIDPLYVIVWLYASIGRIIIYIYFSYMIFQSIFNIKNEKIIIYTVCVLVGLASLYLSNTSVKFMSHSPFADARALLSAIFVTIIPLFITIVYFFRRKSLN